MNAKRNAGWRQMLAEEPWAHDFYWALNRHEALADGRPRLGDSSARREEYLDLGQVPFLDFPASSVASYEPKTERGKARLRVKFLGLLGPMGPLPTTTTDEALRWFSRCDDAFVHFLDIFNNRFLQLFFRAHSESRPASHRLRPKDDRFRDYVGSAMGIGAQGWRDLDSMPDLQKVAFAGLLGARGTSASRIEHLVAGVFGASRPVRRLVPRAGNGRADARRRRACEPRARRHGRAPRPDRRHQVPAAAFSRHARDLREVPAERRMVPAAGGRDRERRRPRIRVGRRARAAGRPAAPDRARELWPPRLDQLDAQAGRAPRRRVRAHALLGAAAEHHAAIGDLASGIVPPIGSAPAPSGNGAVGSGDAGGVRSRLTERVDALDAIHPDGE